MAVLGDKMPYVRIEMLEGRTDEEKSAIAKSVTQALVEHGRTKADSVFVVFEDVSPCNWARAGVLLSDAERS